VGNPSGTAELGALAALEEEDGDTGGKWILQMNFPYCGVRIAGRLFDRCLGKF